MICRERRLETKDLKLLNLLKYLNCFTITIIESNYFYFLQKLQLNSSSVYYNNVSTLPMTNNSYSNSINNSNNLHHVQHKNLLYQTLDGQINSIATTSKDFTTLVTTNALANSSPATSLMSMSLSSTTTIPSTHQHHLGGSVIGPSGGSMSMSGGHITVGGSDLDLNINAIKDRLMTTRVPESCV